ncbi:MAG: SCO family protein [Gammaproteobacteria bacterium]
MRSVSNFRLVLCAALTLVLFSSTGIGPAAGAPKGSRWGADYFPNFPVTTHEGKTVRFYDELIKDKMVVVNFIYTSCPDVCSLSTARLAEVVRRLGDTVNRDVFVYSISLDPENDTPEILSAYARAFDTPPGWLFITGEPEHLGSIRHKLGERSRSLGEHRSDVVLGNDATGEWSRSSVMATFDYLVSNVRALDPRWRDRAGEREKNRTAAQKALVSRRASTGHTLHDTPGEALFLKACSSCHAIGKGDVVGPDLYGVTRRRERDWLVRFMMRPDLMRARKDPIAVQLDAQYEGVSMPNLSLSETDVGDLLIYIQKKSEQLSETQALK